MKIDFSNKKLFTIFITFFYVFGLFCVYQNCEIISAFLCSILLSLLLFFGNFDIKKTFVLFLIFFLGIIRANNSLEIQEFVKNINYSEVTLQGKIITSKDINTKKNKIKFYLKTNKIEVFNKTFNTPSKILVVLDLDNYTKEKIKTGDYIILKGKLTTPMPSTNPYQFDYKKYLLNQNCAYILYGENSSLQKTGEVKFRGFEEDSWYYILRKFDDTREKIIKTHSKNIKSPNLEILGGIVFGNETINPDEKIKENFKNSGLLHLLAASGLNVALIYGIWMWICSIFKVQYRFSIFAGCIFIVLYTFMTGFPPSILRASLMLLFVLFGKLMDRNSDSIALIFFVGFLILLFSPKMIFDIGFQLSFVVTLGLIVCCSTIIEKFDDKDKKYKARFENSPRVLKFFLYIFSPKSIVSILCVPLVAQIWVVPLQMYYFNTFSPFSVLANIAVVPFIGFLSFVGFVSSIFALIPSINEPMVFVFDFIANPMLTLLVKISEFFSSFKYSILHTVSLSVFQIFWFWGIILVFVLYLKKPFKKLLFVLFFIILVFSLSFIRVNSRIAEVIMFDVSNADSFLIKTKQNKYILIDTGKKNFQGTSSGETIINRYLKNKNIRQLDILIITHFDIDHSGGAIDILKNTKVKSVILQKEDYTKETAKEIFDYLKKNNIPHKIAQNNDIIYKEKDLTLKTFKNNLKSDNESSIITLLKTDERTALFMGDMGVFGYRELEKYFPKDIDILKVGHHGAKNTVDDEMLDYLRPKYALISTGVNKYNHPDFSTIDTLLDHNIKIISSRNYGFSKIILSDEIKFLHFDKDTKKIKSILFDCKNALPFHKSKFIQNLIREYS